MNIYILNSTYPIEETVICIKVENVWDTCENNWTFVDVYIEIGPYILCICSSYCNNIL